MQIPDNITTAGMEIHLAYGKTGLGVEIPDRSLTEILTVQHSAPLSDPTVVVEEALLTPIGSLSLHTIASSARSACIAICDITRPVPNQILLPPLLKTLGESDIKQELAKVIRKAEVVVVSRNLARGFADQLPIRTFAHFDDALRYTFNKVGDRATVAVIPKGPYMLVHADASTKRSTIDSRL